jgi:hypothetical protein
MHWIHCHQAEIQAISAAVTAFLTLALIIVTAIYVGVNYKTMRLLTTDLRYKAQPIPLFNITVGTVGMSKNILVIGRIGTASAALRVESVSLHVAFESKSESKPIRRLIDRVIVPGDEMGFQENFDSTEEFKGFSIMVVYRDLIGLMRYTTEYDHADKSTKTTAQDVKSI